MFGWNWIQHKIRLPFTVKFPNGSNSVMANRQPDFICVGAQKAGTTTLDQHLRSHSDIYLPRNKELQYFSNKYSKDIRWYYRQFAGAEQSQRIGELTPYYLFHPFCAERISNNLPDAKIIILLRDPVARAVSGYFHSRRLGNEPLELEAAMLAEPERLRGAEVQLAKRGGRHYSHQHHSYISRSRYEIQIKRYFDYFPKTQLLLLQSEAFFRSPSEILSKILRFLDLAPALDIDSELKCNSDPIDRLPTLPQNLVDRIADQLQETYRIMDEQYDLRWDRTSTGMQS